MAWGHNRSVWISEEIHKMCHELQLEDSEIYPNTNQVFRVGVMVLYRLEKSVQEFKASERKEKRRELMRFQK